jgi:phosphate transport system permease protein
MSTAAGTSLARRLVARLFEACCLAATLLSVLLLAVLLGNVLYRGAAWLNWSFLTSFPSRFPAKAGVKAALWGSVWLITLTTLVAVPVGIGSAIYLEEYGRRNWWSRFVQTNIANLAGVPSIVYGILGLALFVRTLALGRSVLAGSLTMALVILPVVIIAAQESLRAVPDSIRHASYALGATRWQTVWHQVLPAALPGLMTGIVLAISRAMGEAAPLIMIGALTYIAFVPRGPMDPFTALPIQIFNWSSRPQQDFRNVAAAGIIVLLVLLLVMNTLAVIIRHRSGKQIRW